MIPVWKETLVVMVVLIIVEVAYRVLNYVVFKMNNLSKIDEEEE